MRKRPKNSYTPMIQRLKKCQFYLKLKLKKDLKRKSNQRLKTKKTKKMMKRRKS